jgi:hypothetical protein
MFIKNIIYKIYWVKLNLIIVSKSYYEYIKTHFKIFLKTN